ncbi:hypothetical protein L1987_33954 [Smallanthus sonchifolius]|uniref:Uncharacterized protein n=1 Tax=Smallanthus sonchifolius TaxID=185202 RepID=A0ACB9HTQ2_9ASTR|nr:hypothetical protein L1987_33954 [Smallanthus sonchifolius]
MATAIVNKLSITIWPPPQSVQINEGLGITFAKNSVTIVNLPPPSGRDSSFDCAIVNNSKSLTKPWHKWRLCDAKDNQEIGFLLIKDGDQDMAIKRGGSSVGVHRNKGGGGSRFPVLSLVLILVLSPMPEERMIFMEWGWSLEWWHGRRIGDLQVLAEEGEGKYKRWCRSGTHEL